MSKNVVIEVRAFSSLATSATEMLRMHLSILDIGEKVRIDGVNP